MSLPVPPAIDRPVMAPAALQPGSSDPAAAGPVAAVGTCANCLAPISDNFCGSCGAPRLENKPLTVRRFADELWGELTSVDSSTMRTARALFTRPGELTRAYLDGRTRWYLSPLRVYLLAFTVYLFGQSMLPISYEQMIEEQQRKVRAQQASNTPARSAAVRPAVPAPVAGAPRAAADPARELRAKRRLEVFRTFFPRMGKVVLASLLNPWFQLLNVAPWAVLLSWLYRRRRRNYAENVVMALHLLAINILLQLVDNAIRVALGLSLGGFDAVSWFHFAALGVYFYLATRRVYQESPSLSVAKSVLFVAGAEASMFVVMSVLLLGLGVQVLVQALLIR